MSKSNKVNTHSIAGIIGLILTIILFVFIQQTPQNTTEINPNDILVAEVVDGDTIKVIQNGEKHTIRFIGIDTPETSHPSKPVQCFGIEAKNYLTDLLLNKTVTLERDISDVDRYGRQLRYVYLGDTFINEKLVKEGYAFEAKFEPDIKYQEILKNAEEFAMENKTGLWNKDTCNGIVD